MIKVYVNHREPHVTIHPNPNCAQARVGPDENPRHVLVNADNLSKELGRFRDGKYRLASEAGVSDLWLIVDFLDYEFETAVAAHLKKLLGLHDPSIAKGEVRLHDCRIAGQAS